MPAWALRAGNIAATREFGRVREDTKRNRALINVAVDGFQKRVVNVEQRKSAAEVVTDAVT